MSQSTAPGLHADLLEVAPVRKFSRLAEVVIVMCAMSLSVWLSGQWIWSRALGTGAEELGFWSTAAATLFLPSEIWFSCGLALISNMLLMWVAGRARRPGRARALAWACCAVLGAQMSAACALERSAAPGSLTLLLGLLVGGSVSMWCFARARHVLREGPYHDGSAFLVFSAVVSCLGVCVALLGTLLPLEVSARSSDAFGRAVMASVQRAELSRSRDVRERNTRLELWEAEKKLSELGGNEVDRMSRTTPAKPAKVDDKSGA